MLKIKQPQLLDFIDSEGDGMKGLFYTGLSALILATSTAVMPTVISPAQAQMQINANSPIITDSGILGSSHFINVAVLGMSLEDLMITLPSQMQDFESVRVTDQSGKEVPANITTNRDMVAISFAQPVVPNTSLKVEFTGVQMRELGGASLLYRITGQRVGLTGEIPIGTAQVSIPIER
jgi:hypothetical protein